MKRSILLVAISIVVFHISNLYAGEITLEKIFLKGTFSQKYVSGLKSMQDGWHYTMLESVNNVQQINKYDYEEGKLKANLLSDLKDKNGTSIRIESYELSMDEQKILISTNSEHIYRHSRRSEYYVYDIGKKSVVQIGKDKFQLAQFSPDGNYVSFVRENNIFMYNLSSGKEQAVTTDGKMNEIINGAPDWVYEEEFTLVRAYQWSRDSKYLAYYKFNESQVKEFSFPMYGTLYPVNYVYKYPKAGEDNSVVEIYMYNLSQNSSSKVKISDPYEYVPRIQWTYTPNILSIQLMNRLQNYNSIEFANAETGESHSIYEEYSNTYQEVNDLIFLKDGMGFLRMSEESGFNNVYYHEYRDLTVMTSADGTKGRPLLINKPGITVTSLIGYHDESMTAYMQVTDVNKPQERKYLRARIQENVVEQVNLPEGSGSVEGSESLRYMISYISNVNHAMTVSIHNSEGDLVRNLEDNQALMDTVNKYNFSTKEFFKFNNRNGDELVGWMIKPKGFKPTIKYPVLMYVYGGPGSQTATNSWGGSNDAWYQYLAAKGYIIVSVDNRGTGNRGKTFRDCTYGQLGKLESEDQIDAAKYLASQEYVDGSRIGIWGWSYGGYMSTLCLAKGNDVFKMAIAVAPVTNWRYYDSIYTERYMGLPSKNGESYDENSPINHVGDIKGKFLLIHGMADDNVHFQNTAELIEAMVQKNVDFDLGIYPNKNHGIYGGNTRYHLYNKMNNFILENL
ncbi:MAG TPA: S9 family peptidase [Flavobacteriales bacterium]|nr:S9 family peptidase [Flavobacteriales bacterium]